MKIHVREQGLAISAAERRQVEERLALTLARFSGRIGKVVVRFSPVVPAATRGKLCRIEVDLRPQSLHVEDEDVDVITVLDRAANRLARAVAHALERR